MRNNNQQIAQELRSWMKCQITRRRMGERSNEDSSVDALRGSKQRSNSK